EIEKRPEQCRPGAPRKETHEQPTTASRDSPVSCADSSRDRQQETEDYGMGFMAARRSYARLPSAETRRVLDRSHPLPDRTSIARLARAARREDLDLVERSRRSRTRVRSRCWASIRSLNCCTRCADDARCGILQCR